jgi:hypothetical protein
MVQSSSLDRFSRAESAYRALLWVYSADYRREYETLMVQLFRDLCRDAYRQHGSVGLVRLWQRVLADTVITAAVEHIHTLEEGVHMMSKQHQLVILSLSGLPLVLGIILLLVNPKFMLQLLAPNAAQPIGWLMTAAIVGLVVAAYMVQRKVLRAATDSCAGAPQNCAAWSILFGPALVNLPLRYRLSLAGSLLFLVFPALLLVLFGPAFVTLLLSGILH